jgi:RNA polymerase sigma-70 factor (ECF subfamily)
MTSLGRDRLPELMARYQAGDLEAFEEIYRETVQEVERYLSRHAEASDRSDLVQEVYLQVHRARRTYQRDLPFQPWLFAIARHVALMAARRRRRKSGREVLVEEYPEPAHAAAAPEPDVLGRQRLARAIRKLSPEQREVVRLAHVEGLTSTEIGHLLGATPGAVKVRLHRARLRLRGWFGGAGGQDGQRDE